MQENIIRLFSQGRHFFIVFHVPHYGFFSNTSLLFPYVTSWPHSLSSVLPDTICSITKMSEFFYLFQDCQRALLYSSGEHWAPEWITHSSPRRMENSKVSVCIRMSFFSVFFPNFLNWAPEGKPVFDCLDSVSWVFVSFCKKKRKFQNNGVPKNIPLNF